ncbi:MULTISPECIES: hypothetical protein [Halorussus]|uniref:hypothetical protein n=1 Tax=Halorussus TaxID=1070314 RepID=UPI000E20FF08|nr:MULTISPECIES: hypothetical protein [Halorussus]NHN58182.1 hypothetical protein [Halorussus sp. JP-T4]
MVPAPDEDPTRRADGADAPRETDDGGAGFDEAALYGVVRKAVEDAILGVIGTLLLLGVAAVVLWTGVAVAMQSTGPTGTALGGAAVLFGLYLAAATLEIIPPAREWF